MRAVSVGESVLIRLANLASSRGGPGATLAVLTFHRVLPRRDPLLPSEPDAATFTAIVELLASHFNVLPLSEAIEKLQDGALPPRAVCITFDDGYANNRTVALPILAERGLPATVFVASGFLDGALMFNDLVIEAVRRAPEEFDLRDIGLGAYRLCDDDSKLAAIATILSQLKYCEPRARTQRAGAVASRAGVPPDINLMMTREQLRQLHRYGVQIGGHTVNHPILTAVDSDEARSEIVTGKRQLEEILGAPITVFAFPNGKPVKDYDRRHLELVREAGYAAAFSTAWGTAARDADLLQLPRIAPWGKSPLRYGLQIAASFRQSRYSRV